MSDLLIEIGSEEIPAGYIEPAISAMASMIESRLDEARIGFGNVTTFGTPKRLTLLVENVDEAQTTVTEEVTGPPEKVGFDENGTPLTPAVKFAEKLGIAVEEITIKETKKGRYLCGSKTEEAQATRDILKSILPEIIGKVPFPKTMRWADLSVSFARPVTSVLALFGNTVVPFEFGDIKSDNKVYGHRFMNPGAVELNNPADYSQCLKGLNVIVDIDERKALVREEITKAAASIGGSILQDEELVGIVANLIEYPVVVVGTFDNDFLELPAEVLITAMREHQKYFAVVDENGKLMPNFVVVNNTRTHDMALVTKGHEKVLRARLADAKFFYNADLKESNENRVEKLKGVLFQASLGTMLEKTNRIETLSGFIAGTSGNPDVEADAVKAAGICKSDLVSQVVVEFPKLQGIMGRVYAGKAGESNDVATAVEEHYMPLYSGAALPETVTGSIVALADKIDTICGCFSAGLIPTGASDPYALRRQSIGIIQIMLANRFRFSLVSLIEKSVSLFGNKSDADIRAIADSVIEFIKTRIGHLLVEDGFSKDVTASVTDVSVDVIPDVWARVEALESLKNQDGFEPIAVAFKRVVNIIKKAGITDIQEVDGSLFEAPCESGLHERIRTVSENVATCLGSSDYNAALSEIATLREPVDTFFDDVMVMAENEAVKNNRLALLSEIAALFANIADFSKIST